MISFDDAACIAYAATFNGEEDIYFMRVEQPIVTVIERLGDKLEISWNAAVGRTYCVQVKTDLSVPWEASTNLTCLTATSSVGTAEDRVATGTTQRFYRVVKQP